MDGQIQQIQFTEEKKTRFSSSPNFPTKNDGNQNSSAAAATATATCLSICALDWKEL